MGFLRRLFGQEPRTDAEPTEVETPLMEVASPAGRRDPLEGFDLDPLSAADAKLTMKELRLRRKELQAEKRDLAGEAADQREAWRERQAGRYTTTGMGRGTTGRLLRSAVQGRRRSERLEHASALNRFADAKAEVDADIAEVDLAIIELQRYVLEQTRQSRGG